MPLASAIRSGLPSWFRSPTTTWYPPFKPVAMVCSAKRAEGSLARSGKAASRAVRRIMLHIISAIWGLRNEPIWDGKWMRNSGGAQECCGDGFEDDHRGCTQHRLGEAGNVWLVSVTDLIGV